MKKSHQFCASQPTTFISVVGSIAVSVRNESSMCSSISMQTSSLFRKCSVLKAAIASGINPSISGRRVGFPFRIHMFNVHFGTAFFEISSTGATLVRGGDCLPWRTQASTDCPWRFQRINAGAVTRSAKASPETRRHSSPPEAIENLSGSAADASEVHIRLCPIEWFFRLVRQCAISHRHRHTYRQQYRFAVARIRI
jgi:hypothetical protein